MVQTLVFNKSDIFDDNSGSYSPFFGDGVMTLLVAVAWTPDNLIN